MRQLLRALKHFVLFETGISKYQQIALAGVAHLVERPPVDQKVLGQSLVRAHA